MNFRRFFNWKSKSVSPAKASVKVPSEAPTAFFVCTFSLLGKLAESDGSVSEEERETVLRFIDRDLALTGKRRELALKIFEDARQSPVECREYAERFYKSFSNRVQLLDAIVDAMLRVSVADGTLAVVEDELIRSVTLIFNFGEKHYERLKFQYLGGDNVPVQERHYETLGLEPNASDDDVRQRYLQLQANYHPDGALEAGMPEEFIGLSEKRFALVEKAYAEIKRERGMADLVN